MKLLYALPLFAFTIILIVCIFEKNLYTYKSVSDDWLNNPQKLRFQRSPTKGYVNFTRNITQTYNPSLEGIIYDLKMINDFDLLITDYPGVPLIQLLSGIRSREFPPNTINDEMIKEINSSGKNGYIMLDEYYQKKLLNYYSNSPKLPFNKSFKDKYGLLLVQLPLPFAN